MTDELTDEADESDTEELVDEYVEDIPVFEQPAAPQATVDENAVTLTWTQVITTEQVDGYVVTLQSDDGLRESYVAPGVTEFTFTAVPQGIYTATVALYGPAGQSDPSQPSAPIAVDSTLRTVAPSIAADGDLAVGATVTISGAGLDANLGDVRVELHSDPVVLGSAPVAADGTYNFTVTIPDGVVAGEHSLVAFQGDLEVARAAVTVPAPLVVTSTTQIAGLIILAALAVLGVLTLVVQLSRARRREANSSQAARHASRAAATEPSGFAPVAGESVDAVPAAQLHTPERPVSQGVAQPQFPQPGRNSEREYAPVS